MVTRVFPQGDLPDTRRSGKFLSPNVTDQALIATMPADSLRGSTMPRLFTPPLRPLTPETSYGFEVIDFAEEIEHPLFPWQQEAVIRGGELLPDGRPRFRIVLLLVARQNGKTELPVVLSVWWQFRKNIPLILGTSTKVSYAKESWQKAINLVKATRALDDLHEPGRKWYRRTNGETESWTTEGARYLIAAANEEGGRSLTVHRGIADELRQHHDYSAWEAMEPACSPPDAQIWALSNAGSARSVVLNELRSEALNFIQTGEGDPRLGLLEWSAPEGSDPEDVAALLQANPRVGYGLDLEGVLLPAARRAKRAGGAALASFKTERMCLGVTSMDPAVDFPAWTAGYEPGDLSGVRARVAMTVDVSPDGEHVTAYAAAVLDDGRVRVDHVADWSGQRAVDEARREIPAWVHRVKPAALGWLPSGPGAVFAADLKDRRKSGRLGWPPPGVAIEEIRSEVTAVCAGFAEQVRAGRIVHGNDPLLNAQVETAEKLSRAGSFVFVAPPGKHVDAVYAAAGAVHLARTLPTRPTKRRVLSSSG